MKSPNERLHTFRLGHTRYTYHKHRSDDLNAYNSNDRRSRKRLTAVFVIFMIQSESFDAVGIVWDTLNGMAEGLLERSPFLVIGLIVLLIFWGIGRLTQRILLAAGDRTRLDITLARLLARLASAALFVLGLLVAAVIVFPGFSPGNLVAGLGITSVAIGFAFKDVLQNFFAGILLLWRRPFIVGDEIIFKEFRGKVEEITVRSTRVRTYDGERAIIPNGEIYTSAVTVRTAYPQRRIAVSVGVGYHDDVYAAQRAIVKAVTSADGVLSDPTPQTVVNELAASSINFLVYFWIDSRRGDAARTTHTVMTSVKNALDAAGIEIPYPHSVVLFHDQTGAPYGAVDGRASASRAEH